MKQMVTVADLTTLSQHTWANLKNFSEEMTQVVPTGVYHLLH
jgi:hypothetical protein